MPFRFRRSIGNKFFRINFNKNSVSTTTGIPGLHMTQGPRGTYVSAGIPGSGMSYTEKIKEGGNSQQAAGSVASPTASSVVNTVPNVSALPGEIRRARSVIRTSVLAFIILVVLAVIYFAQNSLGCFALLIIGAIGCLIPFYQNYVKLGDLSDLQKGIIPADWSEEKKLAASRQLQEQQKILSEQQHREARRSYWLANLDRVTVDELSKEITAMFGALSAQVVEEELVTGEVKVSILQPPDEAPIVVMVVHTFEPVGVNLTRKAYGMTMRVKASHGFIFTNSSFTKSAEKEAVGKPLSLVPRSTTIELLAKGKFTG